MRLLNHTRAAATCALAHDKTGQAQLLVLAKATFVIPAPGKPARLAELPVNMHAADVYSGVPGTTSATFDHDFVLVKPRCEVLLCGHACAPGGVPAPIVDVGLRVGSLIKAFRVTGYRIWESARHGVKAGEPAPFTRQRIGYDLAFGGMDGDDKAAPVYWANPIGRGYHASGHSRRLAGQPMPQTEARDAPIVSPAGHYPPMAFGPLPRNAQPRLGYAGTYDARWVEARMPVLPADFDERYYQSAPPDQQVNRLAGGEQVALLNLTEEGDTQFVLPGLHLSIEVKLKGESACRRPARADTLCLEPDARRFTVTWRLATRLHQSLQEVESVEIGWPVADQRRDGLAVIPVGMLKKGPFPS